MDGHALYVRATSSCCRIKPPAAAKEARVGLPAIQWYVGRGGMAALEEATYSAWEKPYIPKRGGLRIGTEV
jgi:hypothetical protein